MKLQHEILGDTIFSGTCMIYGMSGPNPWCFACDVTFDTSSETSVKELRAYREIGRKKRLQVPKLRKDTFHDDVVVVMGPKVSPAKAVKYLEAMINEIQSAGMLIGRYEPAGDYYLETIDGKIVRS